MCGRRVEELESSLASVLPGYEDACEALELCSKSLQKLTFAVYRKVNFDYFSVRPEYCLQVGLHDIAGEVGDNNDFRVRVCWGRPVHVDIFISKGAGRKRPAAYRHLGG